MSARTASNQFGRIATMASTSMADHVLTKTRETTWSIGRPGSSVRRVYFHFDNGVVCVWGDHGEFVLRCSDRDSFAWLVRGSNTDGYCDYVLGKVCASDDARREFMLDDARAFLDHWKAETEALASTDPDAPDDDETIAARNKILEQIEGVSESLDAVLDEYPEIQSRAWLEALYDINYDDPPACDGWSAAMLWLWQSIIVFVRLWHQHDALEKLAAARPGVEGNTPDVTRTS